MVARKLEKYLTRQFEEHVSRDSVEREQKYRIARVDTIRKRLLKLGAQVHASGFERNELYDCDDRLRRQDLKLRLRCHGGKITRRSARSTAAQGHVSLAGHGHAWNPIAARIRGGAVEQCAELAH